MIWGSSRAAEMRRLFIILFLALIHGLLYVFFMPPWQHYDEPNHFEYVWLAAHLDRLPGAGDRNATLNRQVIESMLAHGFYKGMDITPDLSLPDEEKKIGGYSQLNEPPLYYLLASIPVRFLSTASIETQLYAARLVSLVLFLITILVSWGIVREVVGQGHPLRWLVPLSLALLPAFVDLMTAVNNDVLAVLIFSLFLWGGARLILHGFSLLDFLWTLVATGLAYFAKNTAIIAILLLPVVLLFSILRNRWQVLAWGFLVVLFVAGLVVGLSWDDARYWYRASSQIAPARLESEQAIWGKYVFMLETGAKAIPSWSPPLFQPLSEQVVSQLQAKEVVLGGWIWATQPAVVNLPILRTEEQAFTEQVIVDEVPRFYAFRVVLPEHISHLWIYLHPEFSGDKHVRIFYDGLLLVEGDWADQEAPRFSTNQGDQGEWGGKSFTNLIRNSSAEISGPRVNPWVDNLATNFLPDKARPSLIIASLMDWQGAGWLYRLSLRQTFQTFWARFGWGHVPLIWPGIYTILLVVSLIGVIGGLACAIRRRRRLPWGVIGFFGLAMLISWAMTLTRGIVYIALPDLYLPVARHSYPVIIPTMMFLCAGWLESIDGVRLAWLSLTGKEDADLQREAAGVKIDFLWVAFLASFLLLDLISLWSIVRYYSS
jgi:hypothetical protein